MEDVRPKVATGNSVEGKPRRVVCGTRRKPEDNCTAGSPILLRLKPNQMQATQVPEEPWATEYADFVGPLPRSKHGNQMLLVMIDRFSKWTELAPLRSATAESLKKAFRERIIARYGVPKVVITDSGEQFESRIFKSFRAEMGISQQFTAPYTPQDNPTERANRTVRTTIAQFAGQDRRLC